MIFYFSGTGNSLWAARLLAEATDEKLINMADSSLSDKTVCHATLQTQERIGFVFPVHSWGAPPIVEQFINKLTLENYHDNFTYMACTCGDDIGLTATFISRLLSKRGWKLNSAYSIQMPNTYVCLPGFDIDGNDLREKKLSAAEARLQEICREVCQHKDGKTSVVRGRYAWVKSHIIRPAFLSMLKNKGDRPFHTTNDCTGCGLCKNACPVKNIDLNEKRPRWNGHCTQCLACYHICPAHAIRYGKQTDSKGQYWHDRYVK